MPVRKTFKQAVQTTPEVQNNHCDGNSQFQVESEIKSNLQILENVEEVYLLIKA